MFTKESFQSDLNSPQSISHREGREQSEISSHLSSAFSHPHLPNPQGHGAAPAGITAPKGLQGVTGGAQPHKPHTLCSLSQEHPQPRDAVGSALQGSGLTISPSLGLAKLQRGQLLTPISSCHIPFLQGFLGTFSSLMSPRRLKMG